MSRLRCGFAVSFWRLWTLCGAICCGFEVSLLFNGDDKSKRVELRSLISPAMRRPRYLPIAWHTVTRYGHHIVMMGSLVAREQMFSVCLQISRERRQHSASHRLGYTFYHDPTRRIVRDRPQKSVLNWNKKFELMLTGRAKAYSSSCSQTVSLSPAISSRPLRGYRFLMPSCAGFLEPGKSRLRPSKFTFNAENFICSLSMSISIDFGAIRFCNTSRSPKSPKKP